ncbi:hypothetical protein [Streptomyces sp. NBC_01190]|uniref:hypothetical protein n=1 Tax=Streptomyces sp. NBC_01190 TaxID=2903767 RepID=UPI00386C6720|nr:hypothetical protein OG519_31270 [Streptomyces sp. NBC_01190]
MDAATVTPEAYRQFAERHRHFYLVTDERLHAAVRPAPSGSGVEHLPAPAGCSLEDLVDRQIPEDSDVLVVSSRPELLAATDAAIGPHRTVVAVPVTADDRTAPAEAAHLLDGLRGTDPLLDDGPRLRTALLADSGLTFTDGLTGLSAHTAPASGAVVRHRFGPFTPGTLHTAPDGWLTLAARADGVLPLDGELTVKGQPAVFSGAATAAERGRVHEGLRQLTHYPVVLTVDRGRVTGVKVVDDGSDGAGRTLTDLIRADDRHARVHAIGFGVNPAVTAPAFGGHAHRCAAGSNGPAPYVLLGTGGDGTLELLLRLENSVVTAGGETLTPSAAESCAAPTPGRRRMNRVKAASCGCH